MSTPCSHAVVVDEITSTIISLNTTGKYNNTTQTTTSMLAEINNYLFISLHMKQLEHSTHATSMLPMT